LCGRRHMALHCQIFQENLDLGGSHTEGMPHAVESDEEAYPVTVGLLGPVCQPESIHRLSELNSI
jgi:hypothetical protein